MANLYVIQKKIIMLSKGVSFKFDVVKFEKGNFVGKSKFKVLVQHVTRWRVKIMPSDSECRNVPFNKVQEDIAGYFLGGSSSMESKPWRRSLGLCLVSQVNQIGLLG